MRPSGAGILTVSGFGVTTVKQRVKAAGTVIVKLKLSKTGLAALRRHHHRLLVHLEVLFKPNYGSSSSAAVSVIIR